VRVAYSKGGMVALPVARMTSGVSAANSAACRRFSVALAVGQRMSRRLLIFAAAREVQKLSGNDLCQAVITVEHEQKSRSERLNKGGRR
jgi:hypothetical protein